jgi:3-hydroxyisobutyrate dehydrogenase
VSQRVAILGLGTMGAGMAKNMLSKGISVSAYNRTRAKAEPLAAAGARIADSPADAAQDADVIISMLSDQNASRTTWTCERGALSAAKKGAVLIESSTVTPKWIAELAGLAAARGLSLLDAPVTGSRMQADAGELLFLVGGDAAALERARPVLATMSKDIIFLGPSGSGARMKLINNFLCGVQVASLAEGMAWIERSGLDRDLALKVLKSGAPGSPLLSAISGRMVEGKYDVNFLLSLMDKDLRYAAADALTFGIDLSTAKSAEARFWEAIEMGHAGQDMSAVVEPLRAGSGVKFSR